jgi:hypothetical protein
MWYGCGVGGQAARLRAAAGKPQGKDHRGDSPIRATQQHRLVLFHAL